MVTETLLMLLFNDGRLTTVNTCLIPNRPAQLSPATCPTLQTQMDVMGMFRIQYEHLDVVRWLKPRSISARFVETVVPRLPTFGGSGRADHPWLDRRRMERRMDHRQLEQGPPDRDRRKTIKDLADPVAKSKRNKYQCPQDWMRMTSTRRWRTTLSV